MTTQPDPKLLIGPVLEDALSLFTDESPATKPYRMWVTGEGASFGNGEPITRVIDTFLTDITYIVIDGYTTRDVNVTVWVEADTPNGLSLAERDLMAQLYKANLLWWKPPHVTAPWAVFEVATSKLLVPNLGDVDFDETELRRSFTINLTCGAWVRSKDLEVAGFIPEAVDVPTEVVFSTGATLTNVSTQRRVGIGSNPTLSLVSGTVKTSMVGAATAAVSRTIFVGHTFDPDTPYIRIDLANWSATRYAVRVLARKTGTTSWEEFGFITYMPIAGGGNRYFFERPSGSLATDYDGIAVDAYFNLNGDPAFTNYVSIDNVKATDEPTSIGTARQSMFTLDVGGSVEAVGVIEVTAKGGNGLGTTLVYTCVDDGLGNNPALRPYRTAGPNSPVIDADTASGYSELLGDVTNPTEFKIPVGTFADGTHDIVFNAWTAENPDTPIFWRAELLLNDTYIGLIGSGAAYGIEYGSGVAENYAYYCIGQITLPAARLGEDSPAVIHLKVWGSNDDTITYDDGYILNIDVGAYTAVDCGTGGQLLGGPASTMRIAGPTLGWPAPSIMLGIGSPDLGREPESFFSPPGERVQAWGRHSLPPGTLTALVVAGNSEGASAEAQYYRRSHTNTEQ